ncbi:Nitrogen regulation protein, NtrB signal transduction histidine kinase [Rhodobacterales bacterium HTCC2150]|nr:Nitrogen regulation protein, NtrB signal transduction histidine kinase [Rhodobacterales bacterium HTCC2150] [Rhodobacteraceae bacterium HTCC2150]
MTLSNLNLWASLPIPALVIDPDDAIADINPAAEQFLNMSARSLKGAPVWDRLFIDAPLEASFARVRGAHAPMFVNNVDVGSGERAPVQCNLQIAPIIDQPNWVVLLLEPREIADRLGRAFATKTAARSVIGMAEMLAHEIKNPLAGIMGAAQLLAMNISNDDQEMTDLIVQECRRILKLLGQVEEFGNVRPPDRQPVNLHDVLDRTRKLAQVGFAAHMRIIEDYDPSLPHSFGDSDQLQQVFMNLLKNAAEANPKGGTIRIKTSYEMSLRVLNKDGTGSAVPLHVEIIDDGPGLPAEIADDIFDPFISGRENGTGLGLALVSKIVSDHEGWITVDSVPGKTVFKLSLPMAPKTKTIKG